MYLLILASYFSDIKIRGFISVLKFWEILSFWLLYYPLTIYETVSKNTHYMHLSMSLLQNFFNNEWK